MQLDALIGSVLIQAPGCSDLLAVDALRKAAIQLCEQTSAWQESFTQSVRTQDVDLDVPEQSRAVQILRVYVNGQRISPVTAGNADLFGQPGVPDSYYRTEDNVLRLIPAPSDAVSITADVVLAPLHTATAIPDDLANRCRAALIHGALAYLLAIPGHTWTQPVMAAAYLQMFANEISVISVHDNKSRVRAALRVRSSYF